MTDKKYKETDKGFVSSEQGFENILRDPEVQQIRDQYKVPIACPACNKLMYNWDTKFFYRHGVCADCTVDYIEDRTIDPEIYNNRSKLLLYVKEMIEEKNNRKRE